MYYLYIKITLILTTMKTQKLVETLKKYGKSHIDPIQEKDGQKYFWATYYIDNPQFFLVKMFDEAAKENVKIDHRRFNNGVKNEGRMQFLAEKGYSKGESCGRIRVTILNFA
jgi:hypothetical protein